MKIPLLIILLLSSTASLAFAREKPCQPSTHAKLPAIAEFSYDKARKALLAGGCQPLPTKSSSEADTDPDISSGNGAVFWRKGYVEVEACGGAGVAPCAFLFKDAYGNRLRVTTAGEENPKRKAYARVTGFQFLCE
jgi:hypothetical protein